jgi:hypothetical protein
VNVAEAAGVVAEAELLGSERLPAASTARTSYEYVVLPATPVSEY